MSKASHFSYVVRPCTRSTKIARGIFGDICRQVYVTSRPFNGKPDDDRRRMVLDLPEALTKGGEVVNDCIILEFTNGKYVYFGAGEWLAMSAVNPDAMHLAITE